MTSAKPASKRREIARRDAEQRAFESLSPAITKAAAVGIPDIKKEFVLQTDASDYGLGAVLAQEFEGVLRPVTFASHTLTPAERNYTITKS